MFTAPMRVLLMSALLTTACGATPSSPTAPGRESSIVLEQGQTATPPGTDLTITLVHTYIFGRAAISCAPNVSCNYFPHATLHVVAPGVGPQTRGVFVPNPIGGPEAFSYGGYVVRATGLDPAWSEGAALRGQTYKVLLTVTGK